MCLKFRHINGQKVIISRVQDNITTTVASLSSFIALIMRILMIKYHAFQVIFKPMLKLIVRLFEIQRKRASSVATMRMAITFIIDKNIPNYFLSKRFLKRK